MQRCFGNVFVLVNTRLVDLYRTSKMMFPMRNDVAVDCPQNGNQGNTLWCTIVRTFTFIFALLLILVMISWLTTGRRVDENENTTSREKDTSPKCTIEIGEEMKEEIRSWIQKEIQNNAKLTAKSSRMSPEQMRNLIKEEIKRHQKIQLKPDFASASAGGMILEASPTWTEGYTYIYFLFIPLRSTAPPPSIILEPTRQAGDCWPMVGKSGRLLIQLAARANIVGFTLEHIDPAMSLSGGTPEAPSNFSVYGLESYENPEERHLFGTYCYDNKNEDENQYFRVQNINRKSFLYIELEILSNHGNKKYTCLYRFQVHGYIDRAHHCPT